MSNSQHPIPKVQYRFPLVLLILLMAATGCRSGKEAVDPELADPCQPPRREAPRILLLNFEVFENDSIAMINSAFNAGRLRTRPEPEKEPVPGDLVVTFMTADNIECNRLVVSNPLTRRVEFSEDYYEIRSRTIVLDAAIFSVRTQFHNNLRFAKVEKVTEDGKLLLINVALR